MVDLIFDEQEVKTKKSNFLKITDGAKVRLKSHLIKLLTFFDNKTKKSILWDKKTKQEPRVELYYWANVNGEEGVVRIPASVFVAMNEVERLMKKSKRDFEWIIGKKGEGLGTRYNVVRGEEVKVSEQEVKEADKKLFEILHSYERVLKRRLEEYIKDRNLEEVEPDEIPI